jgi:hypothetical protein
MHSRPFARGQNAIGASLKEKPHETRAQGHFSRNFSSLLRLNLYEKSGFDAWKRTEIHGNHRFDIVYITNGSLQRVGGPGELFSSENGAIFSN